MKLTSPTLVEGSRMPEAHTLEGGNRSPALAWDDVPEGTKSFAITCYDPDAPTCSGWWHWLVIDLPGDLRSLPEGAALPAVARGITNDFGFKEYGGARPPKGDGMHRYVYTVWALPTARLEIADNATAATVGFMLNAMALGKAKITATYVTE